MARIFQADIRKEPYFVHVLKLALRHYSEVRKNSSEISCPIEYIHDRLQKLRAYFEEKPPPNEKRL